MSTNSAPFDWIVERWHRGRWIRYHTATRHIEVLRLWGPRAGYWIKKEGCTWTGGSAGNLQPELYLRLFQETLEEEAPLPSLLQMCTTFEEFWDTRHQFDFTMVPRFSDTARSMLRREYNLLCLAMRQAIPCEVLTAMRDFKLCNTWRLLQWFNRMPTDSALALAMRFPFIAATLSSTQSIRRSRGLMVHDDKFILKAMGFATDPVSLKLLQDIPAENISPFLIQRLREELHHKKSRHFLNEHWDKAWFQHAFSKGVPMKLLCEQQKVSEEQFVSMEEVSIYYRKIWHRANRMAKKAKLAQTKSFQKLTDLEAWFLQALDAYERKFWMRKSLKKRDHPLHTDFRHPVEGRAPISSLRDLRVYLHVLGLEAMETKLDKELSDGTRVGYYAHQIFPQIYICTLNREGEMVKVDLYEYQSE